MKIVLVFIFLLLSFTLVGAHGNLDSSQDHHDGIMDNFRGMGFGLFGFMWIFWILVFVALILSIIWLVKQLNMEKKVGGRRK